MDDTTRSSTGPPVSTQFQMRRVGDQLFDHDPEQRTYTGVYPVVREDAAPGNVCDLLSRFMQGSLAGNVRVVACGVAPPRGLRIALGFEAAGTFVPVLLELLKEVVIDGRAYFRMPRLDGEWRQEGTKYVVEMGILLPKHGKRFPPLQSDNVRLVFRR